MKKEPDKKIKPSTDRQKKVVLAFIASSVPPTIIKKKAGFSLKKTKATLQELIEMGVVCLC